MIITNSQIKSLIEVYQMINDDINGFIPLTDISNKAKIKRYEKVLNDLLIEKIDENISLNDLYLKTRTEIFENEE